MNFSVFDDKKEVDGKVDYLSNISKINYDAIIIMDRIKINQKTGYKLNVLAKRYYGDENKMDVLMKFNKIRNIFKLREGQIIEIPDLESYRDNTSFVNLKPIKKQSNNELGDGEIEQTPNSNSPSYSENEGVKKKENGVVTF